MSRGRWFGRRARNTGAMESVPEGIATKCNKCAAILFARDFERNLKVCTKCGHHHRLNARERLDITVDENSFEEMDGGVASKDPLKFPGYAEKLANSRAATGLTDAIVTGIGQIDGRRAVLGVSDFGFVGGSMGCAVGEKIARAIETAIEQRLPVIMFTASGGARMHEGLLALMQMAKTSAAAAGLDKARLPYIVVLTDPTTGGVFASYATLGDIILAEPGATIGFAGRRVGNQDVGVRLPDNFQTSEFQWEHGMVDRIVPRRELKPALSAVLGFFEEANVRAE